VRKKSRLQQPKMPGTARVDYPGLLGTSQSELEGVVKNENEIGKRRMK
jgi:hypothetical protein